MGTDALRQKSDGGNTENSHSLAHGLALKGGCNEPERKWPFLPI